VEVLKQPQYQPLSVAQQASILYAVNNGLLDDVPVNRVRAFETGLHAFLASNHKGLMDTVEREKELTDPIQQQLTAAINEFKANVPY
jgi:F-type H+-transporting ATPase subunit alpha